MDKEHFLIVAGEDVSDKLDQRLAVEVPALYSLTQWQEQVHAEGYRGAELVRSINGWTLRYASGLEDFNIIHQTWSFEFAIAEYAACRWQIQQPHKRYVYVRRSALT